MLSQLDCTEKCIYRTTKLFYRRCKMAKKFKIAWAMNPFDEDENVFLRSIELLKLLNKKKEIIVVPTFVLSPETLKWAGDLPKKDLQHFAPQALSKMEHWTKKLKNIHHSLPHIIFNTKVSTTRDVKAINHFAIKNSVDLILCANHTRSDLSRMFLGSFTESLLMVSKVPLLIVPNRKEKITSLGNVAFPVDLINNQSASFKKLGDFVSTFGSKLTLLHKIPTPIDPLLQNSSYLMGGGWISVGEFFKLDIGQRKQRLNKLKEKMASYGVKAKVELLSDPGSIAESVQNYKEAKRINLIALNTSAKTKTTYFLGSVARAITKEVDCPIWIFHT